MKQWLLYPLAALVVTALLYFFAHVGIGWSAFIAFLGLPLLGTAVTADDDFVGGWSNPNGTATPDWETPKYWGRLCGGAAAVCIAFFLQFGLGSLWPVCFIVAAVVFVFASVLLLRRSRRVSHHAG
jgi:hypothetical protein